MDIQEFLGSASTHLKSIIGSQIDITMLDAKEHSGILYTVDPVSNTIVLFNKKDPEVVKVTMLMAHAIKTIDVKSSADINSLDLVTPQLLSFEAEETYRKKRIKVEKWFKKNMINFENEGENIKVDEHLIIEPPYEIENCYCSNAVVLERICELIKKMPLD